MQEMDATGASVTRRTGEPEVGKPDGPEPQTRGSDFSKDATSPDQ
jgi:hypothetical protein